MDEKEYVDFEEVTHLSGFNEVNNHIEIEPTHKTAEEKQREKYNKMLQDEEFARVFMKLHTPLNATKLPGRNDICPYCNSGKKFKKCECYKTHKVEYRNKYFIN